MKRPFSRSTENSELRTKSSRRLSWLRTPSTFSRISSTWHGGTSNKPPFVAVNPNLPDVSPEPKIWTGSTLTFAMQKPSVADHASTKQENRWKRKTADFRDIAYAASHSNT